MAARIFPSGIEAPLPSGRAIAYERGGTFPRKRTNPGVLRPARAVAGFAAALGALALPTLVAQAQAGSWQASEDDYLVLEARIGNYKLLGDIGGYFTDRGVCVDFSDIIHTLDLPVELDENSRRATGWLFSEDRTLTVDRGSDTVQIMGNTAQLRPGDIYDTPEGWCVDIAALSDWTGLSVSLDRVNLLLDFKSDPKLPFLEAMERKSRAARLAVAGGPSFDISRLPQAELPYRAWRTPALDVMARLRYDQRRGADRIQARYELFASGELAGASVDARLASDNSGHPESLRMRAYRFDPEGGLLGPLAATQVAIGDVETHSGWLAGRSGVGRGAYIGNYPLNRSSDFSVTTLRGAMPAGWDAELYRNGQLIAYQGESRDGRYEFADVELLFGPNDFEVVLYGPQGQIRRESSSIPVGMDAIEPGQTYYWAGIIEQGEDLLDLGDDFIDPLAGWRWGVGAEHGLDKRTSLGLGVQSLAIDGTRHDYAEAILRRAIGPALVEFAASHDFGRGTALRAQALGQVGEINFQAQTLWIDGGYESDIVEPYVSSEHSLRIDTRLRLGRMRMPVQAGFRLEDRHDGTRITEWLLRGSIVGGRMALTAELGHLETDSPYGPHAGTDDGMRLGVLANARLGGISLRSDARFRLSGPRQGFESFSLIAEKDLTERSELQGRIEYHRFEGRTDFRLAYSHEFDRLAIAADGRLGSDGSVGAGLSVAFSLGPRPGGGIHMSHERLARTGSAQVTVFEDADGDGRRSPGERLLPEIGVNAGQWSNDELTGEDGRTMVGGLRPHLPVLISVDSGSLPDPFLIPTGPGKVVTPRPGIAASVELGLAPTGEVEGVLHTGSGNPREGVLLELVDARGEVVAKSITEYDGFFLFEQVPYGIYSLRVAAGSAGVLGVERDLASRIGLSREEDIVRVGVVRLVSATIAEAAADPAALAAR